MAAAAAKLIRTGDVVTLDGGATTLLLAKYITGVEDVTFVVNSLRTATILADKLGGASTYLFAQATDFDRIFVDDRLPVPQDLMDALEGSDTILTVVKT